MVYTNVNPPATLNQSLDDIDFGEVVPSIEYNNAHTNALVYSNESLEFDMQEFPEFLDISPPRLPNRHINNSDNYLDFSDLSVFNNEDFEEFVQLDLPSSTTKKNQKIEKNKTKLKRKKNSEKKNPKAVGRRKKIPLKKDDDDFDVLTSTLEFLKLHKENIFPKQVIVEQNDAEIENDGKVNFDDDKDGRDKSRDTYMKSIKCLQSAKELTCSSLLNEKENLRKKLVAKYLKKRTSLLKNAFVKQRILANAYIENENKLKAISTAKQNIKAKDPHESTPTITKKEEEPRQENTKDGVYYLKKKRKSFDATCNPDFVNITMLKRPCLTRKIIAVY